VYDLRWAGNTYKKRQMSARKGSTPDAVADAPVASGGRKGSGAFTPRRKSSKVHLASPPDEAVRSQTEIIYPGNQSTRTGQMCPPRSCCCCALHAGLTISSTLLAANAAVQAVLALVLRDNATSQGARTRLLVVACTFAAQSCICAWGSFQLSKPRVG
jgi:hypothetical protein